MRPLLHQETTRRLLGECAKTLTRAPLEDIERALLPFVQVGRPMLAQEGSGLGLPLSRQLVERLGGRFQITSSVAIGTTVTITMPNTPPAH